MGGALPISAPAVVVISAASPGLAGDGFPRARVAKPASTYSSSPRAARRGSAVDDWPSAGRASMERGAERVALSEVVADCMRRWFQDALKEAKAGDVAMQVLVGQMYCSGYGVPRNEQKGKAWILKASQSRSSALRVGDKHPGYNASDSDSDDVKADTK